MIDFKNINKTQYRTQVKYTIAAFVVALAVLSIVFGQLFISLWGAESPLADGSTGNFKFNVLGVVLAALLCSAIFNGLKGQAPLKELFQVWSLKQLHNKIYRKHKKIQQAAEGGDENAYIILSFYLASQKAVYLLDDNTLTLPEQEAKIVALQQKIKAAGFEINPSDFTESMLDKY
ncbi:DUF3087 family protein [Paraferrimonas sp. SM1919]|uniref:DUF3087 family protein n=1 Tax=Paraferrimonas sp. SM1919 TaxID=2662263 RepID=UPI0013D14BE3|nr:DUF3087 family protein [Paraferrimonas sp. SM1919]